MSKKIVFISQAIIKISKSFEDEAPKNYEDIDITYEHPILSLIRKTKKDKDYINIYCGKPTYVLMKVKKAFIGKFIDALKNVLSKAKISEEQISELESEVRIYGEISETLKQIITEVSRESMLKAKSLMFTLKYFDPTMRKTIKRCIINITTKQVTREIAKKYYEALPDEVKAKYTMSNFIKLVMQEVDIKKIAKNVYNNIRI